MIAKDGHYSNFRWGATGEPQQMRVERGRVVSRGSSQSEPADSIDLDGKLLYPAFVDCHCHILPAGLQLSYLDLSALVTRESVLDAIRDEHKALPEGKWLRAVQYEQTKFPNAEHLTRSELDAISSTRPILIRHASGHASVANSAALLAAGVHERTPDPEGGCYRRGTDGRMDGVLLEHAHEHVTAAAPKPTHDEMVAAILAIGEKMAQQGIGMASDMMTGFFDLETELRAYRTAAEKGCPIRTRLYLQWSEVFGPRSKSASSWKALLEGCDPALVRVAGIKIFADGAIGSATAAIYGTYTGSPPNPAMVLSRHGRDAASTAPGSEVSGQLIYAPEKLNAMVRTAHDAGYQVAIHAIGDYATDLVMDAYTAVDDARRHRIEHAMLLSDAQIERMSALGCHCVMQPEFLMKFGNAYVRQLGDHRASKLKRFRSVIDEGIPLALSSDRPIVPGNPRDGLRCAVERPSGFDQSENITGAEAFAGYTRGGALANEDSDIGELAPGQLADFQLSDAALY